LKVHTLVVFKEGNLPPLNWIIRSIQEVHAGKDEKVRVVTVKAAQGVFKRQITELAILLGNFIYRSLICMYVQELCPNALPWSVLFHSSPTVTCLRFNSAYSCINIPSYNQSHFCYQRNQSASRLIALIWIECSVKTNKNQFKQLHFCSFRVFVLRYEILFFR